MLIKIKSVAKIGFALYFYEMQFKRKKIRLHFSIRSTIENKIIKIKFTTSI